MNVWKALHERNTPRRQVHRFEETLDILFLPFSLSPSFSIHLTAFHMRFECTGCTEYTIYQSKSSILYSLLMHPSYYDILASINENINICIYSSMHTLKWTNFFFNTANDLAAKSTLHFDFLRSPGFSYFMSKTDEKPEKIVKVSNHEWPQRATAKTRRC